MDTQEIKEKEVDNSLNVVFLDFDGVVNIPLWQINEKGKLRSKYNNTRDGIVNSFQAIQWVSEFCEKYNYSIVVSSTWRRGMFDYRKCLYDSGLRPSIKVLGCTPIIKGMKRGDEITKWLSEHPEVKNYLIFDDDADMTIHMRRLVKCDCVIGFTLREYTKATILHEKFKNGNTWLDRVKGQLLNIKHFKVTPFFRWYDLWVGIFIDTRMKNIYIIPFPMLGIKINYERKED